jgi:hypothetical protein
MERAISRSVFALIVSAAAILLCHRCNEVFVVSGLTHQLTWNLLQVGYFPVKH